MKAILSVSLFVAAVCVALRAQTPPPMPTGGGDGPWNHRVLLATSMDGLAWKVGDAPLAERASVPELFLGPDGRPVLLFVDASGGARGGLGALVRRDDGTWTRRETNLRGADPNVVRRKEGGYFAYTKEPNGAIIVFSSDDGLQWRRRGVAFQDDRYPNTTDADVFETPGGWVALISLGPRLLRCTSADGLKFSTDGEVLDLGGSVSDTVAVEGGWRTFFHVNPSPRTGGRMVICSAFTADGKTWRVEPGDRVIAPAEGPARFGVADPAPLRLPDGSWLMAIKSFIEPPRFDARMVMGNRVPPDGQRRERGGQPMRPGGPWNQDVDVWRVSLAGEVKKLATFERAGVPTIARLRDGRLIAAHQHFPADDPAGFDKVAVHFSSDEGETWTAARVIGLRGLPEDMRFPFDPTLVPLPDGRVRLYFTSLHMGANRDSWPAIYSAISADGVDYAVEPGGRFAIAGRPVIDCAVALHGGVFHLFAPDNGTGPDPGAPPRDSAQGVGVAYHATSRDGLNFTREADVHIDGRRRWLGNAMSDGKGLFFIGTGEPGQPFPGERSRGGIWLGGSADGANWATLDFAAVRGADPGAVVANDGGWVVVSTSEPRRSVAAPNRAGGPR